jgi:hypothetical protein
MVRQWIIRMLAVAVIAGLSGCSLFSSAKPELVAQTQPTVADIPLPEGFHLDEKASRHNFGGAWRLVDHLYKGRADRFAVYRFYQQQMPGAQWTMVRARSAQTDSVLEFDKGSERCSITISKGDMVYQTYIKVMISTAGSINPPSGAQGQSGPGPEMTSPK